MSKINDSIISFCSIDNAKDNDFLFIISPDSIIIFEAPDRYAFFAMNNIIISDDFSDLKINPMLLKIETNLDLIFRQEQSKFFRFIGFCKEKQNRIIFIDNYYDCYSSRGFCHTSTIKNSILNPKEFIFKSDREKELKPHWGFPFSDNLVNKDSILHRIRNINNCKDTIVRRINPFN